MKIELKSLKVSNFKGIKSLSIDFFDITTIEGENRTGKTTIFDAFNWLLFGKNHEETEKFNIKPLDKNNKTIDKLQNEVTGVLLIDGKKNELKRTHREIWRKKRGESEESFSGNETIYGIDSVPKSQKEYNEFISSLVDNDLFKLVTSPTFFNSLHWEKRRALLIDLIGGFDDYTVLDQIADVDAGDNILKILKSSKSIEDTKKEIANKKRKIKDELSLIPPRIDEVIKSTPDNLDWAKLEANKAKLEAKIKDIDNQITDKSKVLNDFYKKREKEQKEINSIKEQFEQLELNHNSEFNKEKNKLNAEKSELQSELNVLAASSNLENTLKKQKELILIIEKQREKKLSEWHELNDSEFHFDEDNEFCTTCKQRLPDEMINESRDTLKENFNLNKLKGLEEIKQAGLAIKREIEETQENIEKVQNDILEIEQKKSDISTKIGNIDLKLDSLKIEPLNSKEYNQLKAEFEEKKAFFEASKESLPKTDADGLKKEKDSIQKELDSVKIDLSTKEKIERFENRLKELKKEEADKNQALADLEKIEFAIELFNKTKMEFVEKKINSLFTNVQFRLFEIQINGVIKEACDTLVNGVPYPDVNTGHKIIAGLDIIKVFSEKYDIHAPIFIDNHESITEALPEMNSQVIKLHAIKGLKELKIY